jgi:hypothetical protein
LPVVIVYLVTANAVVPAKSYTVEMGTVAVGADVTHHLLKLVLVIKLSYALGGVSVVVLQAVPVAETVPPSVKSAVLAPQTLGVPEPPQVLGETHEPQELTVRLLPQLSLAVTLPQFLPRREQNAASVSGAHVESNIWISVICSRLVDPLFAVILRRYCWKAFTLVNV